MGVHNNVICLTSWTSCPVEVKKLMESLVLCGLSPGICPSNAGAKNLHEQ